MAKIKVYLFDQKPFEQIVLDRSQKIVLTRTAGGQYFLTASLFETFSRPIRAILKERKIKLPDPVEISESKLKITRDG